jgi:hypothetical protein
MPPAEVTRRITLFLVSIILLTGVLLIYVNGPSTVADTLPAQLSNDEFWKMITSFSESGGYFRSENLLSNESGYQHVIPALRSSIRPHGVYVGVGPEQNFTYIAGLEPKMAFVVDIRRQNMLEHLLYKALMELSADRAEFLSRLFSRVRPQALDAHSTSNDLVRAYQRAQSDTNLFEENLSLVIDHLEKKKGFALSGDDEAGLRHVYRAFVQFGPDLRYTFLGGYGRFADMPSYGDLMKENDGRAHNWNFLASEQQYQTVRRLQQNNLIVPLVGDFAGPKALRALAEYLKQNNAVLSVFYTSNVEQYLFQDEEDWRRFYENVRMLPVDSSSTFIRYALNSWRFNRRARTLTSPITDVTRAYDRGWLRSYWDVVEMSR